MSRIDRLIASRVLMHILVVVGVFFGLIGLSESLDTGKFNWLAEDRGQAVAILNIVASASRWSIKVLPVTVLIGSVTALQSLRANRELLVAQASGLSIWRLARGPVIALFVLSAIISTLVDAQVTIMNRNILPAPQASGATLGDDNQIWLEQSYDGASYVVQADRVSPDKTTLSDVRFFMGKGFDIRLIIAESATLRFNEWQISNATLFRANSPSEHVPAMPLGTQSVPSDLALKLTSTEDFTFFELAAALARGGTDPTIRAAAATRYAKLMALPALLVGVLLIAFAFTGGYRRTHSYGGAILYGIVMGFVLFVVNEMADRAGSAGVLAPTLAAWGPAIVAMVAGLTLLLFREDGQA